MANFVYNRAAKEIADGTLTTSGWKIMLVDSSYVANRDHDFVDAGGANDPIDAEIVATNYTGGFGGSGRHSIASPVWTEDDANDRAELDYADPSTWTALGGAVNDTIQAAIVIKEGASDDTTSKLIAYIDTSTGTPSLPFTTNGGNFSIILNAEGLIQLSTV